MTLWFGTNDSRRIIANPHTEEETYQVIAQFLDDHNYKSYYTIITDVGNGVKRYDVGSWSEFFWLDESGELDLSNRSDV